MSELDTALRAGVAIYNDGHYHAAHDAWEDHWLELPEGSADERLLHGLIQFTAAIYHARHRNWDGATGLASSGTDYLSGLDSGYRGVDIEPVRRYCRLLSSDPVDIERRPPPGLTLDGERPGLRDVDIQVLAVATPIIAEEYGFPQEPVEAAGRYALADLESGRDDSRFIALLFDFATDSEHRATIHDRLVGHVDRRAAKDADVDGLFDP